MCVFACMWFYGSSQYRPLLVLLCVLWLFYLYFTYLIFFSTVSWVVFYGSFTFILFIKSSSDRCHGLVCKNGGIYWSYSLVSWLFSLTHINIMWCGYLKLYHCDANKVSIGNKDNFKKFDLRLWSEFNVFKIVSRS